MSLNKIKLFQTVADLHSKGKVELTATEKSLIEHETADLIRKSQSYKTAGKAPEGFSDLLLDLAKMDADEAYERIVEFMEESGIEVETEEKGDLEEMKEEEAPQGEDEEMEKPKLPMPPGMKEKEEKEEESEEGGEGEKEEEEEGEKPSKEGDKDKDKDKEEDKEEKREKLIAQAQEMDREKREKGKPPFGKGKGPGPGKKELIDMEDEDKKGQDMADMGMVNAPPTPTQMQASRSKKIKVRITSSGNIVASHADRGPLFHAVPRSDVKRDPNALKRLANKVYGLIVYEGAEVAARKCGARLLAGVDDDIETTGGDIPSETEGVTEEADFDSMETPADDPESDSSMDDAEFDTQETPDKVEAKKRPVARYKRLSGVEDDAEVVTEEKPDPKPDSSSAEADTDTQEGVASPPKDSLSDAEFDIRSVEANYKKLYQNRAQKMAERANREFVEKFAKSIKIAAARMCNNVDEHPLKAAALDTLTSDDVAFSNGEVYRPMDVGTATELIELFSSEGHTAFVDHLLDKTASLMEKTSEYLDDVYSDLKDLKPISIQVEGERFDRQAGLRKSARVRNAAYEGNMGMPLVSGGSAPSRSLNVKEALGGTKVTRRLGSMSQ